MSAIRPRETTALFQTAARVWLTAALLSLALPSTWRFGLWLPVHLVLAGAVATAISGAMQNFALALTAGAGPGGRIVRLRAGLMVAGVAAIAVGVPRGLSWLTALGGASFLIAMALLGHVLWRAWHRSLLRRHPVPMAAYGSAIGFVLVGGLLGALLGTGVVGPGAWAAVRRVHLTLNVLGFASLTVVGTMVTLLPTLLRAKIPPWRGRLTVGLLAAGPALLALGDLAGVRAVYLAGAMAEAAGALTVVAFVVSAFRVPRAFAVPIGAIHLAAGVGWFVAGTVAVAWAARRGPEGFDAIRGSFLAMFVGGWLVQVLLGAWSYLLPMARPGHPDERRRQLAVAETGARFQVAAANGGLLLLLAGNAGWLGGWAVHVGVASGLAAASMGLAKAWWYPWLGRGRAGKPARARAVWGE